LRKKSAARQKIVQYCQYLPIEKIRVNFSESHARMPQARPLEKAAGGSADMPGDGLAGGPKQNTREQGLHP
jgi:hypothetical protein